MQEVSGAEWQALDTRGFPFVDYHFLRALETSGCLGRRTGWETRFITCSDDSGLLGAVVLYLKYNSYGEYIFDFAWAQAYERSRLEYYPKLTSAVPFTPATGPKMLFRNGLAQDVRADVMRRLVVAQDELARAESVSSVHALFIPESDLELYESGGMFLRHSYQFHWLNRGYRDFAGFLAELTSKRRREIIRERTQVNEARVRIVRLTGAEITPELGAVFYQFYLSTIDKRASFDYLTQDFFLTVFREMPDKLLLVLALDPEDQPVAGALNYFDDHTLYGRNWGCLGEYRALHFELCYYQGLEFAIERGLRKFEAGAQGEHKFQRGFEPALTYSAHQIFHPGLARAIRDHVEFEKREIRELFAEYATHSPYRQASENHSSPTR